jgi:predicted PurR-regulated permease PerM
MKVEPAPARRRRPRIERRVRFALETLLLIAVAGFLLSAVFDFLSRISAVTVILIGALFFTYAVYPAVTFLSARMPRWLAILIVYAALLVLLAAAFAFLVPAIARDAHALLSGSPERFAALQALLNDPGNPVLARLPAEAREYLAHLPEQAVALSQQYGTAWASRTLAIAFSALGLTVTFVLIPVISVYLAADAQRLYNGTIALVPARARPDAVAVLRDLDRMLGGYIRGQLLVALIVGTLITIALLAVHVRYALLLGIFSGIMNVIPSVGFISSFIPATLLASLDGGWQGAAVVAGLLIVIQQAEGNLIAPRIVGDKVDLPPLLVLVAILVGAEVGGIFGMFIAVPSVGVLRVLALHFLPDDGSGPTGPGSSLQSAANAKPARP